MRKFLTLASLGIAFLFGSCNNTPTNAQNRVTVSHNYAPQQDVNVQPNDIPGFDVNAFAQLLKSTTNPDALTQAINSQGNNVNNLDLDNDGSIDYLKVDQTGNTSLGVFDELPTGKVQVASLTVNTMNNSYCVTGVPDYCGPTYVYNSPSGITFGQFLFLHWLLTPHSYYHPHWGYHRGYYSGYSYYRSHYSRPYSSSYIRERRTITTRTTRMAPSTSSSTYRTSNTSTYRSTPQTPARTSISTPSTSQRSFTSGEGNRFRSSGASSNGFRSTSSSSRSFSSGSSSSRSFGSSSSRSFGSSSRSSGGRRR